MHDPRRAKSLRKILRRFVPGRVRTGLRRLGWSAGVLGLSAEDRAAWIAELAAPVRTRTQRWVELFKALEKRDLHLFPVCYYSPLPDTRELAAHPRRWHRESDFSTVRYNREEEARLNEAMVALRAEFDALPDADRLRDEGMGPGYGVIESRLLHGMIRVFKPRRVIEVGSGVSTLFTVKALAANRAEGHDGTITCIEPYPMAGLKSGLAAESSPQCIETPVEDVEPGVFRQLQDGDVLFIDSSHTVRIGSDVNYLLLDVLPSLNKGVLVHVHDIPFPYVTPRDYWVFDQLMFWQEPVLLKALLTHNDAIEVIYCSSYLYYKNPAALKAAFPEFDPRKHFPTSIWLRKVR